MRNLLSSLTLIVSLLACLTAYGDEFDTSNAGKGFAWVDVSGTATHFFSEAIVHSVENTPNGMIQRSTDIVELQGDLQGRALFQPVSRFNFVKGKLVNTGHQVFSGTVLGSKPVLLHDEDFRFVVDLNTNATTGEIFLIERIAGPRIRCQISMEGIGMTPAGDNLSVYWGKCRVRQRSN